MTYPSEDAPSLFGLLAAGARDGSVVAYRGTSMAAGLATRDIARGLRAWDPADPELDLGSLTWLIRRAKAYAASSQFPTPYHKPHPLKGGQGQLPLPEPLSRTSARRLR